MSPSPKPRRPASSRAAAAGLLLLAALALLLGEAMRRGLYTTSDEPEHLKAARELADGPGVVSNFEHPVVMKLLAAAALRPERPTPFVLETRDGRRAFPWLYAALVLVAGGWAARRSGALAGLAVSATLVAEPTMRAHSTLVQSDLLLTLFLTAAAAAVDLAGSAAGRRRRWLLLGAGVAYGLGLASKYSALPFLAPFLAVAAVSLLGRRRQPKASRAARRKAPARVEGEGPPRARLVAAGKAVLLLVGLPSVVLAFAVQQAALSGTPLPELEAGIARKFEGLPEGETALAAAERLPRGAAAYAAGLLWVKASATPGARYNYFLGKVSGDGFLLYFPVALALKLTTATVLLLAGAALAAGARLARGPALRRRRLAPLLLRRSGVAAALGASYLAMAALSDVNIGVRHVLPCVPLFLVAAAGTLRTLLCRRRRLAAGLLLLAALLAAAEAFALRGREIPFGNLLAGGPPGIRKVLSDSNVEWGEAQQALFDRVDRGGLGRVGAVILSLDVEEAARHGIRQVDELGAQPLDTVVMSVHLHDLGVALAGNTESYRNVAWLRGWLVPLVLGVKERATSVEPLGDSYLVYRLRPSS